MQQKRTLIQGVTCWNNKYFIKKNLEKLKFHSFSKVRKYIQKVCFKKYAKNAHFSVLY